MAEVKDEPLVRLPEGVELSLHLFLTSDSTGMEMEYTVSGLPVVPTKFNDVVGVHVIKGIDKLAPDFRVMTRAEIADYKKRERDGEADSDED